MTIFLSSTYVDLVEHRAAVKEGLDRIHEPVLVMESFGARPEEPMRVSLDEVDECDLFVGIYAHRYGFVPQGAGASITELEYDHAVETRKPVLAFIVDDQLDWKPAFIDGGGEAKRLAEFKQRLRERHTIEKFTSPLDLTLRVVTSVSNHRSKQLVDKYLTEGAHPGSPTESPRNPPPVPVSLENVALLHTSFRRPDLDDRFADGLQYYQFEVILAAPDWVMDRVTCVTYHLEKAWPEANRTQIIHDRGSRFKMKEAANGTSIVNAAVEIAGQAPLRLNRFIDLRQDGPRL